MAKTTKSITPIRSIQKFNRGDTINSITITGALDLADVEIDGNGDTILNLNRDNSKIDKVETTSEIITIKKYGTKVTIGIDQQKLRETVINIIASNQ